MNLRWWKRLKRYDGSLSPAVIAVLLVLAGIGAGFSLRSRQAEMPEVAERAAPHHVAVNSATSGRRIYPLSVIHGGAYTKEELTRARKTDAVVAAHYADFGSAPEFHKLSHDALMYVSYRRANQVYWSRTKHLIRKGETVISDGNCMARARCGNRLSTIAKVPVSAKDPVEEVLNTPEAPDEPVSFKLAELPGPAGRTFEFNLPASFTAPAAAVPVALAQNKASGGPGVASGPANYFGSGPGGFGGGGGPATTASKSSLATAPIVATLPVATTGGTVLPTSPGYPVTGVPIGTVPTGTTGELVPEPAFLSVFPLAGLMIVWLSRRFRSSFLRG